MPQRFKVKIALYIVLFLEKKTSYRFGNTYAANLLLGINLGYFAFFISVRKFLYFLENLPMILNCWYIQFFNSVFELSTYIAVIHVLVILCTGECCVYSICCFELNTTQGEKKQLKIIATTWNKVKTSSESVRKDNGHFKQIFCIQIICVTNKIIATT